ncbi:hypothetical protein C2G38_2173226 [Gigaspora rosea]|uniref:Uncharacterized protein n=1 Tax=Gigaspora rosea TaxID=44941 RepID=A0A397VJR9_9GLOM|nr:hypothetical protein C2G38_2173226 [Gigaspora rosea]
MSCQHSSKTTCGRSNDRNVGNCYKDGIGIPKDEKKAFELYLKFAEGGNSNGSLSIGHCYQNGIGVLKDEKAFGWCLKST